MASSESGLPVGQPVAATLNDEEVKVLQVLAHLYATHNRLDEAVTLLETAERHSPGNTEVMRALAAIHMLMKRHDAALELADATLALQPTHDDRVALMLLRAQALWGLDRPLEARRAMAAYIEERQVP
ncbi:MAG: tetratricopeptide repeat protein [Pseudomonadota bacterium]